MRNWKIKITGCALLLFSVLILLAGCINVSHGQDFRVRHNNQPEQAQDMANHAKQNKRDLLIFWAGKDYEIPMDSPVRISFKSGRPSGSTTFPTTSESAFKSFQMQLSGTPDQIKDSVLPHEMNHLVIHTIIRRTMSRWLDEGIATLFESETMHNKIRGANFQKARIVLSRYFDSKSYPQNGEDIATLYGAGFSAVEYMMQIKGKKVLLDFCRDPVRPSLKIQKHYGISKDRFLHDWYQWAANTGNRCSYENCIFHGMPLITDHITTLKISPQKRKIYYFSSPGFCPPCITFNLWMMDRDFQQALYNAGFVVVKHSIRKHPEVWDRYKIPPNKRGFPLFVIPSSAQWMVGIKSKARFISRLSGIKTPPQRQITKQRTIQPIPDETVPDLAVKDSEPLVITEQPPEPPEKYTKATDTSVVEKVKKKTEEKVVAVVEQVVEPVAEKAKDTIKSSVIKRGLYYVVNKAMVAKVGFGLAGPMGLGVGAALAVGGWFIRRRLRKRKQRKTNTKTNTPPQNAPTTPEYQSDQIQTQVNATPDPYPTIPDQGNTYVASTSIPDSIPVSGVGETCKFQDDSINALKKEIAELKKEMENRTETSEMVLERLNKITAREADLNKLMREAEGIVVRETLTANGKDTEATFWKDGVKLAAAGSPNISVLGGPVVGKGIEQYVYERMAHANGTHLTSK